MAAAWRLLRQLIVALYHPSTFCTKTTHLKDHQSQANGTTLASRTARTHKGGKISMAAFVQTPCQDATTLTLRKTQHHSEQMSSVKTEIDYKYINP